MTTPDDWVARGKAIAESGKYRPTPNDVARLNTRKGRPASNGGPIPLPTDRWTHRRRERSARRRETVEPAATLLSKLMTAAELDTMTFPDLVEHVPHLITEGFGVLAGSPKAGKSWFAAGIALACAHGGTALGGIPLKEPRHVLLLALEDGPRRLQTRMRRLNGELPLPARLDILTEIAPGTVIATITEWLHRHRDDHTKPMVILDTLGKARPQRRPGDDPYIADYQLGSRIKATVDAIPGSALVAVHHTRKLGAEDWLDTVSGTQGISGSADYILVLRRKRKSDEGTLAVTGRDVAENEYAVKTDDGIWALDGMDILDAAATVTTRAERQQARLGDRSHDAVKFVNARSSTTPKDLAEHLSIDNRVAGNLLGKLRDGGYIGQPARGIYVPLSRGESGESGENAGQEQYALPGVSPLSPHSSTERT
ncbi:hypothetical protein NIIDMKKI_79460 [Mycobacterium kansasii]|uniref:AAA domain protein n=1 Tax=Mycobacterium kansasii TaxID=1768 RepID=A0A7G1IPF2_MYCKA|nr:hypothetical protein NIIDMKKI_79460 [Mycobacterium kansasii]